ncbi:hypothetical protein LTR36_002157 [Oleoguttula mirabilis]|uniref:Uncharacterized protein n=1 Tax=Oleoguttula mirabilis TaxID=1507867 RepID=A0AAV9JLA6_9PEZI|nr:hypothetical protein LTR36_002157 [Oleoguttula mirabilis]
MSNWLRPRNFFIVGGVAAAAFLFPRTSAKANPIGNVFETPGTKNIGDSWSRGGGSNTHTPGAATKRGDKDMTISSQENPKGVDTPQFQKTQNEQKPGEPGMVSAAFSKSHYGSENEKSK